MDDPIVSTDVLDIFSPWTDPSIETDSARAVRGEDATEEDGDVDAGTTNDPYDAIGSENDGMVIEPMVETDERLL
jgi:hypothetical protein